MSESNEIMLVPNQLRPLLDGLKSLYSSEDHSDLVISCQGREWKVHKLCVCAQSDFFRGACKKGFKEAEVNKITLDDDEPQVVEAFIHYLYNFDYDEEHVAPMVLHARMFIIADKYLVAPLKGLAAHKFAFWAKADWACAEFATAIVEVYKFTAPGDNNPMKRTILDVVKLHAKELLDETKDYKDFHKVLGETAEFGKDVSIVLGGREMCTGDREKFFKCPECDDIFRGVANARSFTCPNECHDPEDDKFWADYECEIENALPGTSNGANS